MQWQTKMTALATAVCLASLGGCAYKHPVPTANVGYINPNNLPKIGSVQAVSPIRQQALTQAATSLGARGALAFRSRHIDQQLTAQSSYLDDIFNFNRLLLTNNVLPPVIVEDDNDINLDNNDTIRTSEKVYKIESKARFVSVPPTWRDYLWMSYQKPSMPNQSLLPTNKQEADIWNAAFKNGWSQGLVQANDIFAVNLNRLKRDYLGILLYRKLLAQGMISSPSISKADLGITGDANELRIHDQVSRITADSALQTNSNKWQPVITNTK